MWLFPWFLLLSIYSAFNGDGSIREPESLTQIRTSALPVPGDVQTQTKKVCCGYALILFPQKPVAKLIRSIMGKINSMIGNFLGTSMWSDLLV